jgi:hypothetical protein
MPGEGNETAGSDFSFATADRQFPTLLLRLAFGMGLDRPASNQVGSSRDLHGVLKASPAIAWLIMLLAQ